MDVQYTIAGADGQTYGPVSLAELQTWIQDGRVGAQTNVLRSDVNSWYPAGQYQELIFPSGTTPPPTAQAGYGGAITKRTFVPGQFPELEKKIKNGAGWFFWIAGLSIINSISIMTGSDWGFFLGLGVTQFISGIGRGLGGTAGNAIGFVLSLLVCGLFVLFGIFGNKRHSWAFIVGLVLYLLDGLIFLIFQEWGSFAFHLFASFCIFVGLKANLNLKKELGS